MGSFVRTNFKIRVPNVRVVGADGEMLGVIPTRDAQRLAQQAGLDLVEVSPNAEPPVCKIMDFGKYRYDEGMKRKQARKSQTRQVIKEVKFHANVDPHDLETKMRKIRDFLAEGHKIKLTLAYRGRENAHKELGFEVIQRIIKDLEGDAICEQPPRLLGRLLGCMLSAKPQKGAGKQGGGQRPAAPAPAAAPRPAPPAQPAVANPAPPAAEPAAPAPVPQSEPAPAPVPQSETASDPVPQSEPASDPVPQSEPAPAPVPQSDAAPDPVPQPDAVQPDIKA
ncbi:MAG: translation initiation factor IF-3 [Kiritimatiellae bacterium]|nr:translation initiation factor IF-3 [Kiritimatiellia bacterium]